MASRRVITVYGATGTQGGSVVRSLIQNKTHGFTVRGITRNTESERAKALASLGIDMVQADGFDKAQITDAFRNSWAVFLNTNPDDHSMLQPRSPSEVDLGKSLVDATFEAGVQHLIYSGLASASKITDGAFPNRAFDDKYAIGEYAKTKGFKGVTIVSMGWYIENHLNEGMAPILGGFPYIPGEDGVFRLRMPRWGEKNLVPFISMDADFGDIVHGVLLSPEEYNEGFIQAISQLATPDEIVKAFTKVTGKKAEYEQLESWEKFETYGDSGLETVKSLFGFLENSGGNYYGEPYDLTVALELKRRAAKARGLAQQAELVTLEEVFARHFASFYATAVI